LKCDKSVTWFSYCQNIATRFIQLNIGDDDQNTFVSPRSNTPVAFRVGRIFTRKIGWFNNPKSIFHVKGTLAPCEIRTMTSFFQLKQFLRHLSEPTFAIKWWGGSNWICRCVVRTWPATGLTPLWLIITLWTDNTCADVTLPVVSGFAWN